MEDRFTVLNGTIFDVSSKIKNESIHSIVTSPPYWGQRDCDNAGEIGCESCISDYIDNLCDIFSECHKLLRSDGILWVNINDRFIDGNLQNIPSIFSESMKKRGWFLRQYMPWVKRNAIPKGGSNKPHDSVETIYMFTKSSSDYYYDQLSAKYEAGLVTRNFRNGDAILLESEEDFCAFDVPTRKNFTQHFSTFPIKLASIMVRSSTSDRGCETETGEPSYRILDKKRYRTRSGLKSKHDPTDRAFKDKGRHITEVSCKGWKYKNGNVINDSDKLSPSIVLDPFSGMATTGVACLNLGRKFIGVEISSEYAKQSLNRLSDHAEKYAPKDMFNIYTQEISNFQK